MRVSTFRLRTDGRTFLPDCSQREREGLHKRTTGCLGGLIYRRGTSLFGLTRRSAESAYRLTKRRTADRPPSISLRLPCPEHLNLRFVRIPVDAFRLHNELLTPVKRKRPLVFLIDAQRQARFARLRILQQCFANALGTRSFCNENPLNVVLRQTDEAVDLPGASFSWT